jgi:hypothetical protein
VRKIILKLFLGPSTCANLLQEVSHLKTLWTQNPLSELTDLSETRAQVDGPLVHLTHYFLTAYVVQIKIFKTILCFQYS